MPRPDEVLYEDRCAECGAVADVRNILGSKMCAACAQLFEEEFAQVEAAR